MREQYFKDKNSTDAYNSTEIVYHELDTNETVSNNTYNYTTVGNKTHVHRTDEFLTNAFASYTFLIILTVFLTFARSIYFMLTCMKTSINLHNKMFGCLMRTVMRFFDNNPSGRILNRFSKDMGTMDEVLPKTMLEAIQVKTSFFYETSLSELFRLRW